MDELISKLVEKMAMKGEMISPEEVKKEIDAIDIEVPDDSEIDDKMTWQQTRTKKKRNFMVHELQKLIYTGPKITPKSEMTISSPSCCSQGLPRMS